MQTPSVLTCKIRPSRAFRSWTFNPLPWVSPAGPIVISRTRLSGWTDYSKVVGTHTLRFGGAYHYNQSTQNLSNVVNGNFVFNTATETGIDFADFLIGAPAQFVQGAALPFNGRSHYIGLYGEDSWRVRSNLTLNYGLRWDVSTPWSEQHNEIETLLYPGNNRRHFRVRR